MHLENPFFGSSCYVGSSRSPIIWNLTMRITARPRRQGSLTLGGGGDPGREVMRASIRIDPHTAQITVVSDPLPTILEGIPLQIRTVHVTINRPNFVFNPTNCNRLATTATFTSTRGATSTASVPFYASGCASLPFGPTLTATTEAHTSRPTGASLTITLTSHPGEANIAKTDLQIPSQLPARLTTLQKACLVVVFQANPASCPPGSIIGTATVTTPILEHPLTGPIYLVLMWVLVRCMPVGKDSSRALQGCAVWLVDSRAGYRRPV